MPPPPCPRPHCSRGLHHVGAQHSLRGATVVSRPAPQPPAAPSLRLPQDVYLKFCSGQRECAGERIVREGASSSLQSLQSRLPSRSLTSGAPPPPPPNKLLLLPGAANSIRFLYESGMKNTKAYVANGIAMMVAFFVARIVMGGCACPPYNFSFAFVLLSRGVR